MRSTLLVLLVTTLTILFLACTLDGPAPEWTDIRADLVQACRSVLEADDCYGPEWASAYYGASLAQKRRIGTLAKETLEIAKDASPLLADALSFQVVEPAKIAETERRESEVYSELREITLNHPTPTLRPTLPPTATPIPIIVREMTALPNRMKVRIGEYVQVCSTTTFLPSDWSGIHRHVVLHHHSFDKPDEVNTATWVHSVDFISRDAFVGEGKSNVTVLPSPGTTGTSSPCFSFAAAEAMEKLEVDAESIRVFVWYSPEPLPFMPESKMSNREWLEVSENNRGHVSASLSMSISLGMEQ